MLTKITDMPAKLYGVDKYYANVPDTAANHAWYDTYKAAYHEEPNPLVVGINRLRQFYCRCTERCRVGTVAEDGKSLAWPQHKFTVQR